MSKIIAAGTIKNRSENTYPLKLHIDKRSSAWVEENTVGNKQIAINYLINLGIKAFEDGQKDVMISGLIE